MILSLFLSVFFVTNFLITGAIGKESLMFSQTEKEALKDALEVIDHSLVGDQALPKNCLRVDGILFHSPEQWTVWINGKAYYPDNQGRQFTIESVTSQTVSILIQKKTITLHPDQIYEIDSCVMEESEDIKVP